MKISSYLPFLKVSKIQPRQVISHQWEDRRCILDKHVNLFSWDRNLDTAVTGYLRKQLEQPLKPIMSPVDKKNLYGQLAEIRLVWNNNVEEHGDSFWQDVHNITRDFLEFSQSGTGVLHLRMVGNDACNKFHVDGYNLRLFISYLGPGTEWLPEDAVSRHALGSTNERIVKEPARVKRLGTGHVGILKGEVPDRYDSVKGIVHRSPEISNTGKKRIILRVDI